MHKIELLSPAGSYDAFKAAVDNGADAVYLGGTSFSARAFANNFTNEELKQAIDYAHLRNVRIFVTLNTLLNEDELQQAFKQAQYYYDINVDALIIQDLGLYYLIKKNLPDFEIHASTQMHVHNLSGVRAVKKMGFKRVVLARESDLNLIEEACKEGIEIEAFCHGALCVSYSGQCLLSSATKNRSANRGMCAQSCRLRYQLLDEDNKKVSTDTEYLLSPKDMYLLEDLPCLIQAGVTSLKIEGRMKSPAYVAYVTKMYRKAIDSYYEGKQFRIEPESRETLKLLFNRGFTNTYLKNDSSDLFGNIRPNHMGVTIGKVVSYKAGKCQILLQKTLNQFDGIRIINSKEDAGQIVNRLYLNKRLVSVGGIGQTVELEVKEKVSPGDIVIKTLDHRQEEEILSYSPKKRNVFLHIVFKPDQAVTIRCFDNGRVFEYESSFVPQIAQKAPLTEENIRRQFMKSSDSAYTFEIGLEYQDCFLPVSQINQIRRDLVDFLDYSILHSFVREKVVVDYADIYSSESSLPSLWENDHSVLDVINPYSDYPAGDSAIISELGGLFLPYEQKTAYYTLNVCNSYAYEFLRKIGFGDIILSSELNEYAIKSLIDAYQNRNHCMINPFVLTYGRRALMYLKRDPLAKYYQKGKTFHLYDGFHSYEILKHNNYFELVMMNEDIINPLYEHTRPFFIIRDTSDLRNVKRLYTEIVEEK